MAEYLIPECNIETLRSKIKTIQNKCVKYGCEFHYEELGEEFKEEMDENRRKYIQKYIRVDVSGVARKAGWSFVATVDHRPEVNANIINKYLVDVEVPEKYRHTDCICEHCNQIRSRSHLYLVRNDSTGEFMQVGSSCVRDLTDGLDGEYIARFLTWIQSPEEFEHFESSHIKPYFFVEDIICYAIECVNLFGYFNSECSYSTKRRVIDFYYWFELGRRDRIVEETIYRDLADKEFKPFSDENREYAKKIVSWITSLDEDTVRYNDYLYSLQVVCSSEYCELKDFGRLVSIVTAYRREMDRQAEIRRREEAAKKSAETSNYVGSVNERISFHAASFRYVTSFESQFGSSFLYEIKDTDGNVFTWWSSKVLNSDVLDSDDVVVTGTVKNHQEYRNVKQTVLTRCKVSAA